MKTPTLIHNHDSDWALVLFLCNLFPSVIANQYRKQLEKVAQLVRLDAYVLILVAVVLGNAAIFGVQELLQSMRTNLGLAVPVGIGVGLLSVAIEFRLNLFFQRRNAGKRQPQGSRSDDRRVALPFSSGHESLARTWEPELRKRAAVHLGFASLMLIAVFEEVVYRFYLIQSGFSLMGSYITAVTISTIAYGLIHEYYGASNVLTKMISGSLWFFAMIWTGNLVTAIIGHMILNIAAFTLMRLSYAVNKT